MKDLRTRGRAVKQFGPIWPVAYELALCGTPIGVFLDVIVLTGEVRVVTVDADGELWELRRLRNQMFAVRWCLNRSLRVHRSLGELMQALRSGFVVGWVHGFIVESKGLVSWRFSAVRYEA